MGIGELGGCGDRYRRGVGIDAEGCQNSFINDEKTGVIRLVW